MSLSKQPHNQRSASEQYQKTLQFVKRMETGEPFDFNELLKSYLQLFVVIHSSLETGSEEEGKESLWILNEFRQMIQNQKDKLIQKTGLSFDEIGALVDNPNFFTEDQWQAVQETQKKLTLTGLKLSDVLVRRM